MRLSSKPLSFVVNFLLGVAWASVLLGSITSFVATYQHSISLALVYAAIGAIPGMVGVLLIEHFITVKENALELQRHNKLLEKLLAQKEQS